MFAFPNNIFCYKRICILNLKTHSEGSVDRPPVLRELSQRLIQYLHKLPVTFG